MTLGEIQENFFLKLLSFVLIYPFFLYVNYLSSSDVDKVKELIYSRGRERLLIAVDLTLHSTLLVVLFWYQQVVMWEDQFLLQWQFIS